MGCFVLLRLRPDALTFELRKATAEKPNPVDTNMAVGGSETQEWCLAPRLRAVNQFIQGILRLPRRVWPTRLGGGTRDSDGLRPSASSTQFCSQFRRLETSFGRPRFTMTIGR